MLEFRCLCITSPRAENSAELSPAAERPSWNLGHSEFHSAFDPNENKRPATLKLRRKGDEIVLNSRLLKLRCSYLLTSIRYHQGVCGLVTCTECAVLEAVFADQPSSSQRQPMALAPIHPSFGMRVFLYDNTPKTANVCVQPSPASWCVVAHHLKNRCDQERYSNVPLNIGLRELQFCLA